MKKSRFTETQIVGILKEAKGRYCDGRHIAHAWDYRLNKNFYKTGSFSIEVQFDS